MLSGTSWPYLHVSTGDKRLTYPLNRDTITDLGNGTLLGVIVNLAVYCL